MMSLKILKKSGQRLTHPVLDFILYAIFRYRQERVMQNPLLNVGPL